MAGGGVYRALSFVRYLSRYGWEPTVIAPRGDAYWIHDDRLTRRIPSDVNVYRTETLSGQSVMSRLRGRRPAEQKRSARRFSHMRKLSSGLLMPDSYIGWYPYAVAKGKRLIRESNFDALY